MFQLNYCYFRAYWNRCRPVELKRDYRGWLLAYGKSRPLWLLTKKNCQLKSSATARKTFNICWASWFIFYYNAFPNINRVFKEVVEASNLSFWIFQHTKGFVVRCILTTYNYYNYSLKWNMFLNYKNIRRGNLKPKILKNYLWKFQFYESCRFITRNY